MKRKSPWSVRPVEVRFWEKVNKTDTCWLWTKAKNPKGYGVISVRPKGYKQAHRLSWEMAHGPIPDGMLICHRCDNPACVNPDHLFVGTPADNTRDMLAKNRHSQGKTHGDKVRSSERRYHKLTPDAVRGIRKELNAGGKQRDVARAFGVCQRTVALIQHGVTWTHVDG